MRATKDCHHLYEVLASRVSRQGIGPLITRSRFTVLKDESLDVLGNDEIRSWMSRGLLKVSSQSKLCLEKTTATLP